MLINLFPFLISGIVFISCDGPQKKQEKVKTMEQKREEYNFDVDVDDNEEKNTSFVDSDHSLDDHSSANSRIPLNSSIVNFTDTDYKSCPNRVRKAINLKNDKINLVFYIHYIPKTDFTIDEFCFEKEDEYICKPLTKESLAQLKNYWQACIAEIVENELGLSLLIMLNDKNNKVWRNNVIFDPFTKYGEYSYVEAVVNPIVDILQKTVPANYRSIDFNLVGEMGASIAHYPTQYVAIIEESRSILEEYRNLKFGISFNFNKVLGQHTNLNEISATSIQHLINTVDFVGISSYHTIFDLSIPPSHFLNAFNNLSEELNEAQIVIPEEMEQKINEIGLGGGTEADDGMTPATSIQDAALAPWSGLSGPYQEIRDPWKNPLLNDFRFQFYNSLTWFLSKPPKNLHLTNAYLWNEYSWDVQGLTSVSENYLSQEIIRLIIEHNGKSKLAENAP